MIYSFVPDAGRLSGSTYYFPTYAEDARAQRRRNTFQTIAKQPGAYLASGGDPQPLDYGSFTATFDLYPTWLKSNPNGRDYYNGTSDDSVAIMNALLHFNECVSSGGLGLLTDKLNPGVVDAATGAAITALTAWAILIEDTTPTKQYSHATIQATFGIASGGWTQQPNGVFIPLI